MRNQEYRPDKGQDKANSMGRDIYSFFCWWVKLYFLDIIQSHSFRNG